MKYPKGINVRTDRTLPSRRFTTSAVSIPSSVVAAIECALFALPRTPYPPKTTIADAKPEPEPAAPYGCESWTLRKNEETRIDAFGMKGLRKIHRVSSTAKKTK